MPLRSSARRRPSSRTRSKDVCTLANDERFVVETVSTATSASRRRSPVVTIICPDSTTANQQADLPLDQ